MHGRRRWVMVGALVALLGLAALAWGCTEGGAPDESVFDFTPLATTPPEETPTEAPETPEGTPGAETPGPTPADGGIAVDLSEWEVAPASESAPAGSITFTANNVGSIAHEFVVIASDEEPDSLPVDDDAFAVDESAVDVVDRTANIAADGSESLTVELEAGSYVLICNVPTHYEQGMYTGFTVE